jgi:hypothetical protein
MDRTTAYDGVTTLNPAADGLGDALCSDVFDIHVGLLLERNETKDGALAQASAPSLSRECPELC